MQHYCCRTWQDGAAAVVRRPQLRGAAQRWRLVRASPFLPRWESATGAVCRTPGVLPLAWERNRDNVCCWRALQRACVVSASNGCQEQSLGLCAADRDGPSAPIKLGRRSSVCSTRAVASKRTVMSKSALLFGMVGVVGTLWSFWTTALLVAFVYLVTGGWRTIRLMVETAPRDMRAGIGYARLNWYIYQRVRENATVGQLFQRTAERLPNKPCFITQERSWTYQDVERWTNRVAHCFAREGFRFGEEVSLFTASRPEALMLWLGLSKIGVVSALVNNNLKQASLLHCITCINSRAVIFTVDLLETLKEVQPDIVQKLRGVRFYVLGAPNDEALHGFNAKRLEPLLDESSTDSPAPCGGIHDRLVYIYTSGTTGLPKAAIIKHHRYIYIASAVHFIMPLREDDVLYVCLPLYHVAACALGCSQSLMFGLTTVQRGKFSASAFWDDCIRFNCTVTQYIGEICRYLLAQPQKPQDRQHKIRLVFGNGLRPQIWKEFADRFAIKDIREVYGATEGNSNLVNTDNRVGAVGFVPTIFKVIPWLGERLLPVRLIRVDEVTGTPLRDKKGLCIPCGPNEVGELVGKVHNSPMLRFDGYVSKEATRKKLYTDVFHKGDIAFASGDLLVMDEMGYVYFRDRTGDTFRWKGENVSTAEVEGVISRVLGLTDCVVYGVTIPGAEGRAGMAAILDPDRKTDLDQLLRSLRKELPAYAVPVFIRLLSSLDATSTFKLKKVELQKHEFHLDHVDDPLYFLDPQTKRFVPLDRDLYNRICAGEVRV
ncbi:long-chain fatty acid transport protein 1-like [Ornithodoros turicata]|uniref:long-chain fatty acid transport protein 1-like n=1 Tax=Ornithodoros turicata TaxID=34597 RepID=UPI0031388028